MGSYAIARWRSRCNDDKEGGRKRTGRVIRRDEMGWDGMGWDVAGVFENII